LHRLVQTLAESDRERTIELTALQGILIEKGIATSAEIKLGLSRLGVGALRARDAGGSRSQLSWARLPAEVGHRQGILRD
jgi:hypothetical protein